MSRSTKRNLHDAINRLDNDGGRIPVIRKDGDRRVSHSHDCYMCERGTKAKRMMQTKPRRTREKRETREAITADYGND